MQCPSTITGKPGFPVTRYDGKATSGEQLEDLIATAIGDVQTASRSHNQCTRTNQANIYRGRTRGCLPRGHPMKSNNRERNQRQANSSSIWELQRSHRHGQSSFPSKQEVQCV
jgi:hypothetical protein